MVDWIRSKFPFYSCPIPSTRSLTPAELIGGREEAAVHEESRGFYLEFLHMTAYAYVNVRSQLRYKVAVLMGL